MKSKTPGKKTISSGRSSGRGGKRVLKQAQLDKKHKPSSQAWLLRQLNDPYVHQAKEMGYRSRAAFKLLELDQKFKLLKQGQRVVDLGAAPGGWSQVIAKKQAGQGVLVGVDLLPVEAITGVTLFQGDFTEDNVQEKLCAALGGNANLIVSDMAPNTTGHQATDHLRILSLAEVALGFAVDHLQPGGTFVCKLFQGGGSKEFQASLKKHFAKTHYAKPAASRSESSEIYLVATGFRA